MKKPFDKKVLVLFFFFSITVHAQGTYVNEEAEMAIRKDCIICLLNFASYNSVLMLLPGKDSASTLYHNCHVQLKAGNLREADRYAGLISSSLADTLNSQIHINTFFLKAKIYQYQNNVDAAVKQYIEFLHRDNTGGGLRAEAYASLHKIYFDRRDYKKDYENLADSIRTMSSLYLNAKQQKKSCRTNRRLVQANMIT